MPGSADQGGQHNDMHIIVGQLGEKDAFCILIGILGYANQVKKSRFAYSLAYWGMPIK
jgi:hypothetical protein